MATHSFWSGQIRISLVSFAVTLQPATRRSSQIPLHELSRTSGERIHHQNVTEDGDVIDRDDIIKAYEYVKGEYVTLEPEEIEDIKLPSSDTLELDNFVDIDSIPVIHCERPYFVIPEKKKDEEIYGVFAEALHTNKKAGIGQIALRGREELCAILPFQNGLILETLRYEAELDNMPEFYREKNGHKSKSEYVTLARQLISQNSHAPHLEKFHDHYHEALLELIEAKQKHRKPHFPEATERPVKVVDFAEALKRSLKAKGKYSDADHAHRHRKRA